MNYIALLAQAGPVVPASPQELSWLLAIGAILSGLTPVMLAIVAAYVKIKMAKLERDTKEIKKETGEIKQEAKAQTVKIDQQTERIEEAATKRVEIAATQSRQIDTAMKSGPQPVVKAFPRTGGD